MNKYKYILLILMMINSLIVAPVVDSGFSIGFGEPFLYTVTLMILWITYDLIDLKRK